MTFQSIRNLFLVSLLVTQTLNAQTQLPASGSSALQQGSQDRKPNSSSSNGDGSAAEKTPMADPLLNLLVNKGLLTTEEARAVLSEDPAIQRNRLAILLRDKGVISAAEFEQLRGPASNSSDVGAVVTTPNQTSVAETTPGPRVAPQKPAAPTVIAAIAPIRLLPIDPPQREGLIP